MLWASYRVQSEVITDVARWEIRSRPLMTGRTVQE